MRSTEGCGHVGIDQKSVLKGQSYASLLIDLDGASVLHAVDRPSESTRQAVSRP